MFYNDKLLETKNTPAKCQIDEPLREKQVKNHYNCEHL